MNTEIYLDNNATSRPLPEVREAMLEALDAGFGNPSSAHSAGERARSRLIEAREAVAHLIGAEPCSLFFFCFSTEANNMVLSSALMRRGHRTRIITTNVEHSSIKKYCKYLEAQSADIVYLPVDRLGHISLSILEKEISSKKVDLVTIQWVNNETGVIQPIADIGNICQRYGVPLHTDAAQAVGKIRMQIDNMPIDFLSVSGHKFHGPQGIGVIYAKAPKSLYPILWGGPQEFGMRPGTENLPGIVGIGKAAELRSKRFDTVTNRVQELRDIFELSVLRLVPNVEVNGDRTRRVHNTTNLLFRDIEGQALVARLDQLGIRCSQSSACTNQIPEPSYVLRSMGLSYDEAFSSIRFSLSEYTTRQEIDYTVEQIKEICSALSDFSLNKIPKLMAEQR